MPRRRNSAADSQAVAAAASPKARRGGDHRPVSTRRMRPVSGSVRVTSPTSTSVLLARVEDLDGDDA